MVIELVRFKLVEDTLVNEFTLAWQDTMPVVAEMSGFIKRELMHNEETDEWVDLVHWESMKEAKDAAAQISSIPAFAPFGQMIDTTTMVMSHLQQQAAST
ncbi:MAG: antibiotic biosynthesis monooxygenase [Deinococcota bacterium]